MPRPPKKRWRTAFLLASPLLIGLSILAFLHRPQAATRFPSGFDDDAFASVSIGDSTTAVLATLGDPLGIAIDNDLEYWNYTQPVASPSHMVRRSIRIGAAGRVVSIDRSVQVDYVSHWFSGGLR